MFYESKRFVEYRYVRSLATAHTNRSHFIKGNIRSEIVMIRQFLIYQPKILLFIIDFIRGVPQRKDNAMDCLFELISIRVLIDFQSTFEQVENEFAMNNILSKLRFAQFVNLFEHTIVLGSVRFDIIDLGRIHRKNRLTLFFQR